MLPACPEVFTVIRMKSSLLRLPLNYQFKCSIPRIIADDKGCYCSIPVTLFRIKPDRYFSLCSRRDGPIESGHRASSGGKNFFDFQHPSPQIHDRKGVNVIVAVLYLSEIKERL